VYKLSNTLIGSRNLLYIVAEGGAKVHLYMHGPGATAGRKRPTSR